MKVSRILMMGVATLGLATFANAGTETFTIGDCTSLYTASSNTVTAGYTAACGGGPSTGLTAGLLPYFGNNAGDAGQTLTGVSFSLGGAVGMTFVLQNTTQAGGNFTINNLSGNLQLTVNPASGPVVLNALNQSLVNGYSNIPGTIAVNGSQFPYGSATLGAQCFFGAGTTILTGNTASAATCFVPSVLNTAYANITGVTATDGIAQFTQAGGYSGTIASSGSSTVTSTPYTFITTESGYSLGTVSVTYTYSAPSTGTPEPVSMILFGTGLSALALIGRKRFSRS